MKAHFFMTAMKQSLLAVLLTVVFGAAAASAQMAPDSSSSLYLSFPLVDHGVYEYLGRLQTAGDIPLLSVTRPYLGLIRHPVPVAVKELPQWEWRRYRNEAAANMRVIGWDIPKPEQTCWSRLAQKAGLQRARRLPWLYESGFHFASWSYDTTFTVSLQPVYGFEAISTDDYRGTITRFAGGLRIEGGYARRLHYLVDFRDHTEAGNGPYTSRDSLYEDRWAAVSLEGGSSTSYDISESFLQYYGRDLSIAAGRGRFYWGPARFGSLILNSRTPPFDYVRFDAAIESKREPQAIYYTFLHGWLQSNLVAAKLYIGAGDRERTLNAEKYLTAQRLEVRPRDNLLLGFSQTVVYGDREPQLGYLTPLNFLYSVQHSNDDKDNFLLGIDGTWRPVRGVRIYGEALFDDIVVSELTTSHGSNKSAYTVGGHFMLPRPVWRHFDLTAEYTKIRPFVYTHVFDVNRYTHWTSPIGYTLEPNSEFFTVRLGATFYPLQGVVTFSRQNHGEDFSNRTVGGSIDQPLPDSAKDRLYPFLDGHLVQITRYGLTGRWEALPNLYLFGAVESIRVTHRPDRVEIRAGFGWNV